MAGWALSPRPGPGGRPVSGKVAVTLYVRVWRPLRSASTTGVVRARFGVAETGSVWFSESEYIVNSIGYLVQHLVVLLDPARIVDGLQDVYRQDDFKTARYAVLVTGPSATADIEGVLIRGAQGVRSLTVVLLGA